jgi:hypothetical protein
MTAAPLVVALGVIPANHRASASVTLMNPSDKPMEILGIDATCGCTKPVLKQRQLAPGQAIQLPIGVTGGDLGRLEKQIFVRYAVGTGAHLRRERLAIPITADVEHLFTPVPQALNLDRESARNGIRLRLQPNECVQDPEQTEERTTLCGFELVLCTQQVSCFYDFSIGRCKWGMECPGTDEFAGKAVGVSPCVVQNNNEL